MRKGIILCTLLFSMRLISYSQEIDKDSTSERHQDATTEPGISLDSAQEDSAYPQVLDQEEGLTEDTSGFLLPDAGTYSSEASPAAKGAGNNPGPSGNGVYDVDGDVNGKMDATKEKKNNTRNFEEGHH